MDGLDLFRKLGAGAKFNFKRFQTDAEKLKIIKQKPKTHEDEISKVVPITQKEAHERLEETIEKKSAKRKAADDASSEDESAEEEEELQILGAIKSAGDKNAARKEKKKRKKKRMKTAELAAQMKQEHTSHFRHIHRIHVHGTDIPEPLESFTDLREQYGVGAKMLANITEMGYDTPTPIQMQAITVMMQRRELLACAPTGSGKTAAFLIPVLHHLKEPRNQGFRALILVPTRELAKQTYRECNRLSEGLGFRIHLIEKTSTAAKKFGPESNQKFDVLVTTPNRLIYMLQQEPPQISVQNVEWLVVDESDKLFEDGKTGFRDQLATIYKACDCKNVRRAMFSATFAFEVEQWCKLNLDNVVQVYVGGKNQATELIEQQLMFVGSETGKLIAMRDIIIKGMQPPVLIFVQSKERAKELFLELIYDNINVDVIHAERSQTQRDNVIKAFRSGKIWVLICTDLMGRGIDFKGINLVINYDFPNSAISYIHRIGRTGRAGRPGKAITFFTEQDGVNLRSIANVMKEAGCPVPDYMLQIAKPDKRVRRQLAKRSIKRKTIRTFPLADVKAAKNRKKKLVLKNPATKAPSTGDAKSAVVKAAKPVKVKMTSSIVKTKQAEKTTSAKEKVKTTAKKNISGKVKKKKKKTAKED